MIFEKKKKNLPAKHPQRENKVRQRGDGSSKIKIQAGKEQPVFLKTLARCIKFTQ